MVNDLTQDLVVEAKRAIREYGAARVRFRSVQERLKEARLLVGNDNKVGIAGEFWAIQRYLNKGFDLNEVPFHTNNPAYDFIVSDSAGVEWRISVKSITAENKRGKTSYVDGNSNWDELCIVIMNEHLQPEHFGIATRDAFCARFRNRSPKQRANRNWLRENWMAVHSADKI